MKKILLTLWMLVLTGGMMFPNFYGSLFENTHFGTAAFPTSIPSISNPNSTDSVATVSHSAQHVFANDNITALATKMGVGASTAIANTIFVGNGTGNSIWSSFATGTSFYGTNLTSTGLSTFGSFLSLASSTIVGNLNITGNSTSTNATTTRLAITSFNSQIPYAAATGNLIPLTIGTGLSLSGGTLSNSAPAGGSTVGGNASSTNSNYLAQTLSLTNTDVVLWWGHCSRAAGNETLSIGHKIVGEGATTTDGGFSGSAESPSLSAAFTATSTYLATFEVKAANGCDEGMKFTYLFINN